MIARKIVQLKQMSGSGGCNAADITTDDKDKAKKVWDDLLKDVPDDYNFVITTLND